MVVDCNVFPRLEMSSRHVICQLFTRVLLAQCMPCSVSSNVTSSSLCMFQRLIIALLSEFETIFHLQIKYSPRLVPVYRTPSRPPSFSDSSVGLVSLTLSSKAAVIPTPQALLFRDTLVRWAASLALKKPSLSGVSVKSYVVASISSTGSSSFTYVRQAPLITQQPPRAVKRLKSSEDPRSSSFSQSGSAVASLSPLTFSPPFMEFPRTIQSEPAASCHSMVDAFTSASLWRAVQLQHVFLVVLPGQYQLSLYSISSYLRHLLNLYPRFHLHGLIVSISPFMTAIKRTADFQLTRPKLASSMLVVVFRFAPCTIGGTKRFLLSPSLNLCGTIPTL